MTVSNVVTCLLVAWLLSCPALAGDDAPMAKSEKGGYWLDRSCASEWATSKKMRKCLPEQMRQKKLLAVPFDLDKDGVIDYFLIGSEKEGGVYVVFDGEKQKCIGQFLADRVYVQHRRAHGLPVIYAYISQSSGGAMWQCYMYDLEKYVMVSTAHLVGDFLENLQKKLAKKYIRIDFSHRLDE